MGKSERWGGLIAGIILIIIGIAILLINLRLVEPGFILVALGASFLVAFIFKRLIGFLIPGMILFWLGIAVTLNQSNILNPRLDGPIVLTALGLSFVFIYIFMGRRRHWWPLIPGGILLIIGVGSLLALQNLLPFTISQLANLILPTILIIIGLWLIFRQFYTR
ncbi:MAG: hypothetical protein K6T91_00070 [Firmicutes bacterium]|nr:hypothetical protein [Bacillota bacterium]